MTDPSWYSILPPILAIALAIGTRQVIPSLFAGLWLGSTFLSGFNPLAGVAGALDLTIDVFGSPDDTRVLIFTLVIGALIATIQFSGGISGFVRYLETRRWVYNGRRAEWLAWLTGIVIFIESNITLLVAGSVSRPLFDRYKVSREKLAYIIDSTSAPVCVMIPLNAWGAFIISMIASTGVEDSLGLFIASIPYNFYGISAIILSAVVIARNVNLGPMKAAEKRTEDGEINWPDAGPIIELNEDDDAPTASAAFMVMPIVTMILAMPISLYITGNGDITDGSGSTSILWSVCLALLVAWLMIIGTGKSTLSDLMRVFMKGAGALLPIATILLLALALGDVAKLLGTGVYVANFVGDTIHPVLLAPLIFIVSAFIAFSVGSSWGTFAIMIPIVVPIATTLDLAIPLLLGAAISGAVFGDHASPISDTTVVASMASGTDHIEHVRTQLPYALLAAAIATIGFLLVSIF